MRLLTLSKVFVMESLKELALMVSEKKKTIKKFFWNEVIYQFFPLNMCENEI